MTSDTNVVCRREQEEGYIEHGIQTKHYRLRFIVLLMPMLEENEIKKANFKKEGKLYFYF